MPPENFSLLIDHISYLKAMLKRDFEDVFQDC